MESIESQIRGESAGFLTGEGPDAPDRISSAREAAQARIEQDQRATQKDTESRHYATTGAARAFSKRERIRMAAAETGEKSMRLHRFAARLTPEIEEAIEVLQEGIRLGVIRLDGGIERY